MARQLKIARWMTLKTCTKLSLMRKKEQVIQLNPTTCIRINNIMLEQKCGRRRLIAQWFRIIGDKLANLVGRVDIIFWMLNALLNIFALVGAFFFKNFGLKVTLCLIAYRTFIYAYKQKEVKNSFIFEIILLLVILL